MNARDGRPVPFPRADGSATADTSNSHDTPYADRAPTSQSWDDVVDIMSSLQAPKKITIVGSDMKRYPFLCKPKDDLRKDARMMDLFTAVNWLSRSSLRRDVLYRTLLSRLLFRTIGESAPP